MSLLLYPQLRQVTSFILIVCELVYEKSLYDAEQVHLREGAVGCMQTTDSTYDLLSANCRTLLLDRVEFYAVMVLEFREYHFACQASVITLNINSYCHQWCYVNDDLLSMHALRERNV